MRFQKFRKTIGNQKGQTMVEYILLVLVVVVIMVNLFKRLDEYLVSGDNSFQNIYLNSYQNMFHGGNSGFSGQYKYFTVRR